MKKIILTILSICFSIQASALSVAVYGDAAEEKNILEKAFGVDNITYSQVKTPSELVYLVHSNIFNVGIGNITISKDRYDLVDFSLPYDSVDTKCLVEKKSGLYGFLKNNVNNLLFLFFVIFIFANIIWVIERDNGIISKNYYKGIFDSIYYCFIILTSVGFEDYIRKKVTRIFVIILMMFGMGFYAILVSELTNTEYTKYKISDISHLNDLTVGTFDDTFTSSWLRNQGINTFLIDKNQKLDFDNYDAFIYDEPILRKLKDNNQKILDFSLNRQYYGVVVNKNNKEILNKINTQILNENK